MPVLPSRSWNGDGGSNLRARTWLACHVEGAAEGFGPLSHSRQAQGPYRAVLLAARGETLAIVGNDDPEPIWTIGCERDRGLPCAGVLAHVGQGFLDEPEELERRERREPVGRAIRSEAHRYLAPPVSYTHLRAHETDSYLVC